MMEEVDEENEENQPSTSAPTITVVCLSFFSI